MSKPVIAVDVDDVLAANAQGLVTFSNERWGTQLTVDDYLEHWGAMWRLDHDEVERRAMVVHESGVFGRHRHDPMAFVVLQRLQLDYDLVIVTSRRRMLETETTAWLDRYFANVFTSVHYAGMWDNPTQGSHRETKLEMCLQIGASYLIDDQIKHCVAVAENGIKAILFGNYAWNQLDSLPNNMIRCRNWTAIEAYFTRPKA